MKPLRFCFLMVLLPLIIQGQNYSIHLICPLNEAKIVLPLKNQIHYDEPDFCIVLVSVSDTIVKSVTNGKVTNVVKSVEVDGTWEIVFVARLKNKVYYFWYSGMNKVLVKRNDVIKEGQAIGFIKSGEKIELLMYDFETPVDPANYLDCKDLKKQGPEEKVLGSLTDRINR